ncbi:putative NEMP family protein [Helianthus annuus]|nr:putative NEMP family protein [Helianthus annuus]
MICHLASYILNWNMVMRWIHIPLQLGIRFEVYFNFQILMVLIVLYTTGIDVAHPTIDVTPTPIHGSSQGSKDVQSCERVPVHGISRMKIQSYAKAFKVMLVPSVVIPDKWHNKIQICFHRNASMGLCQCEKDDWRTVHKGLWSSTMSPYEQRFVDVKFTGGMSGSVTVTLDEVSQEWRYVLLLVGIALLFLAPAVSNWVPFYYTSSMAIGILAVILILLYQVCFLFCCA